MQEMKVPRTTAEYQQLIRHAMSEAEFQADIIDLAKHHGWASYHTFDSRRSNEGFPDLVLVRDDQGIFYREIKSAMGAVTAQQIGWLTVLTEAPGGDARVWWPWDWPEIEDLLTTRRDEPPRSLGAMGNLNTKRNPPE